MPTQNSYLKAMEKVTNFGGGRCTLYILMPKHTEETVTGKEEAAGSQWPCRRLTTTAAEEAVNALPRILPEVLPRRSKWVFGRLSLGGSCRQ